LFGAIFDTIGLMDIKKIAEQFNIKTIKIKPIKNAILSKVYVINNEYILRSRTLEINSIQKLNSEQFLLNKVRKIIKIKLPDLLGTKSKREYFIDGNSLWTAYPLIKGEIICAWWNFEKLSEKQKERVFVTLRELHLKTLGKLKNISSNNQYDFVDDVIQRLSSIGNQITTKELKRIQKAINIIKDFRDSLQEKNFCFVHGDYHPGNIIFQKDRVIGLLDFDFARKGSYLEDLAYTLMMFLRNYQGPFEFREKDYLKFLGWYGIKKGHIPILNEYLILYTFYDFHLFRDLEQLPKQSMFIQYQKDFLKDVCTRFN